ncbi:MAG: T9SS type A sorting domain-containing protein [Bacteroidetes bacterium]|nr:T9SS type A sorting domain-containing protein [Bacteroidota bacterium]
MRWKLDTTGKPANFGGITVCDPELCRAENVFQSDFLFTKAVQSSFVIDVISNKKLGNFNFKMYVYNPADSANTVKVLKFAGKSTCANASVKAQVQRENLVHIQHGQLIFAEGESLEKVEIFNLMGQLILSDNSRSNKISLDGIQSGAYVLVAKTTTEDIMQKIVVE